MTFRAIIIGGGPAGLSMARALQLADIDYVVLEKHHEIAPNMGFQLALFPAAVRIFDQLGLLEDLRRQSWDYHTKHNYSPSGTELAVNEMPAMFRKTYGHPWTYTARRQLIRTLYESIPERETRVRTNTNVTKIEVSDTGVQVTCDDGTVEHGSIAIGCDGIRSITRSELDRIEREETGRATNPPNPYKVAYRAFVGRANITTGFELDHVYETRGKGHSYHILPSPIGLWFVQYSRTEDGHTERRYTEEDANEVVKSTRDDVVTPSGLTFGDIWDARIEGGLWDLHEGTVKKWYHGGRLVLVGDSCHKFTPTASSSFNTGLQGVVELANLLRAQLLQNSEPDTATLQKMLKTYHARRSAAAKMPELLSWCYPRVISWHNGIFRLIDTVSPYLGGDIALFNMTAGRTEANAVVLDYVEETDLPKGTREWKHPPLKKSKVDLQNSESGEVAA